MSDTTRKSFVRTFGEEAAEKIEAAAQEHENGVHDERGSDPFKWAVSICIGFQCVEVDGYREHHGITTPTWPEFKQWVKDFGELGSHDGGVDFIALMAGVYNEFMPEPEDLNAAL